MRQTLVIKDRRQCLFVLAVLVISAFLTRLAPLSISPFPFNNDGLTECTISEELMDHTYSHVWESSDWRSHSLATPALNVMMAFVSSCLGVTPMMSSQYYIAVLSVLIVSCAFVLGRLFTSSCLGGLVASFSSLLLGSFVFTTGSVWKGALGIALFMLLVFTFSLRTNRRYRILCVTLLLLMPIVNHVAAVISIIAIAFPVSWRLYVSLRERRHEVSHLLDLGMVIIPGIWLLSYYYFVRFDRLSVLSSALDVILVLASFVALLSVIVIVMSIRNHSKYSFAPVAGVGLTVLAVLDYYGYLFPYTPTSSELSLIIVACFSALLILAWYGSELMIESRNAYGAIQLGFILAPMTIMGFGVIAGISRASHQVVYRTFDYADLFLFCGAAYAFAHLSGRRPRRYLVAGVALITSLVISFPFGFWSDSLLDVRHDTQWYEVDAFGWVSDSTVNPRVKSEERLSYIGAAVFGVPKDATLPQSLLSSEPVPSSTLLMIEESWMTEGVNDYPNGLVVVPWDVYDSLIHESQVLYVGGPSERSLIILSSSNLDLAPCSY